MTVELRLRNTEEARVLLGPLDRTAKLLRARFGVQVVHRGDVLKLLGEADSVRVARGILERALAQLRCGHSVTHADVERWIDVGETIERPQEGAPVPRAPRVPRAAGVQPRTDGQRHYLRALDSNPVVICVGPAGTGKTYLAVAAAVDALREGRFRRIILTRPAVEAGEKLGFLPGDFREKINPYLRPLYDALGDLLDPAMTSRYIENDVIEVCPFAYMRGRTLNNAFIILDEAQNTTVAQTRMLLTRMGANSQVVIAGDLTQIDLPRSVPSGLVDAVERLEGVEGLTIVRLQREDIVRHPIVQRIVDAYGTESRDGRKKRR